MFQSFCSLINSMPCVADARLVVGIRWCGDDKAQSKARQGRGTGEILPGRCACVCRLLPSVEYDVSFNFFCETICCIILRNLDDVNCTHAA